MSEKNVESIVLIVLAVIGSVAIITVLGMWLLHVTMMGTGGIAAVAGGVSSRLFTLFIIAAALIVVALILLRRSKR
jgi:hypothetical protein